MLVFQRRNVIRFYFCRIFDWVYGLFHIFVCEYILEVNYSKTQIIITS